MSFRGGGGTGKVLLPFGLDYADVVKSSEDAGKPQYVLPVNGEPSEIETSAAKQSIRFTKLVSDGPFYTGKLGPKLLKNKDRESSKNNKVANVNEDGIERYGDRYKKVQKIGRTIEEHPYQIQFFPQELYSVMGVSNKNKKKFLTLSKFASNGGLRDYLSEEKQESADEQAKVQALKEQMFNQVGVQDEDKEGSGEKEDVPSEEEDMDDDFDDEDEDDDYNAEKYFDDGDDDGMDDAGDDEAAF
ncbi:RPC31 [Candida theae]|uniref:DNA-directed RNA polymerase III subunit n=1 Tax=Candida theae TaxID=1198502 RepID=A0AAD5BAJ7_9ASCO|nr:RPC31 [Candida theae]KAI5948754.1 RPC31 [Candida theae]